MPEVDKNHLEFSFGWLALKLLGKSLYSNIWSALSELVANGFDAKAHNVYIYLDVINRKEALIEILDDGLGMDEEGLATYVKVGANNRDPQKYEKDFLTMGRKGIGKLAALYLSSDYTIITKRGNKQSQWKMLYQENEDNKEEKPFLEKTEDPISINSKTVWESFSSGTLIQMRNIDLSGFGEKAYDALQVKLANMFALDEMGNRAIYLCIKSADTSKLEFKKVEKEIAFKNMAFIDYNFEGINSDFVKEITDNKNTVINFPLAQLRGDHYYEHKCQVKGFDKIDALSVSGEYEYWVGDEKRKKPYCITGWVGIHASINDSQAKINDERFLKNKFYNPIQLRLYVRNKLAIENFLPLIGNTQAFVNYIEGEIHFDLLDDDDLPDIATSSRQGLNENDPRVLLLREQMGKIVNSLIQDRRDLAEKIKEKENLLKKEQKTSAKKQFIDEMKEELGSYQAISDKDKSDILLSATNRLEGDVSPKSDYLIFISHSSKDSIFTHFIYYLLRHRGAKKTEFFYTSEEESADKFGDYRTLEQQVKENILNQNTRMFCMLSKEYKNSEYCMFEGGAAWATRSVRELLLLPMAKEEMPAFLTNSKIEFCLEKNASISLGRNEYLYLIQILNKMIDHLNAGRKIKGEPLIKAFEVVEIPDDVDLKKRGKTIYGFMEKDFLEYWDVYVKKKLEKYLETRHSKKEVHS